LISGAQAGGENGGADTWSPIRNMFTTVPPVLAALQDQTGMTAPTWMIKQPASSLMSTEPTMSDSTTASH
jgi:flotillin